MTILDTPQYRKVVQDNLLVKKFEDALFPSLLFREEAMAEEWGDQTGDQKVFTGDGLLPVSTAPVQPLAEPKVVNYGREQWTATMRKLGISIDTHTPTSVAAAVNLMLRDVGKLGLNAGDTINRVCRNTMFNAGESGWTVADGTQGPSTTIRVKRLNGFTRARRPDLTTGSPVRYDTVSANNPLPIKYGNTLASSATVVGFTPDVAGDEIGPGTLTLSGAISVTDRDAIVADTATARRIAGGGFRVDDVGAADKITLADLREGLSRLANMDVPRHGDGYFHLHLDPIGKGQLYSDNEVQRLNVGLPDGIMYSEFALGKLLGSIVYENNQCPQLHNVNIPNGSTDGATGDNFSLDREAFAGELYPTGTPTGATARVHRALITGGEWLREYYVDQDSYVTEAGITGKLSEMPRVTSGAVEVVTRGVKLIQRAPIDRWQEVVAQTWRYVGDFIVRPDGATGDGRYYKRGYVILFGEAI